MTRVRSTERFEKVPIDRLVPYARNARTHSKEQIAQLRASIREFGFLIPCLVDGKYNIIAGHGRVLAAREEGIAEVPCVFAEHLTDAQKRAYILADNRLALNAEWDEELLALEFGELKDLGFDLELTRAVSDAVPVPVIASGGVGTLDHLVEGVTEGHASAVLAASIFHFGTYTIHEAKEALAAAGVPVRLT